MPPAFYDKIKEERNNMKLISQKIKQRQTLLNKIKMKTCIKIYYLNKYD